MHAWLGLLAQGIMLALFLTALAAPYFRIEELVLRDWRLEWGEALRAVRTNSLAAETPDADANAMLAVPFAVFIMGAVGLGAWLRFGLGHWRRPLAHAAWIVIAIAFMTVPPLIELARAEFVSHPSRIVGLRWDERMGRVVAAVASGIVAVAGTPIGRLLDASWARQRSRLLARRRRKLRTLRRPDA